MVFGYTITSYYYTITAIGEKFLKNFQLQRIMSVIKKHLYLMGGIRGEPWRRLMNSALQTIILSTLSIQIKHVRRTISLTHTCTANTQRTLWFLCNTEGSEGEIPLNTKPRKNTGNKLKRNIPREPTHWWTLKLTLWIGTDIMSCSLSSSSSPGRERACLRIHTHTHMQADTHIGAHESPCTWRRRSCSDESGQSYHV